MEYTVPIFFYWGWTHLFSVVFLWNWSHKMSCQKYRYTEGLRSSSAEGASQWNIYKKYDRAAGVFRSTATLGVLQIRVSSPTRRDPVATLTEDKKIVQHRIVLKLSGRWNMGQNSSPAAWGIGERPASWVDLGCSRVRWSQSSSKLDHGQWARSGQMYCTGPRDPPIVCHGEPDRPPG